MSYFSQHYKCLSYPISEYGSPGFRNAQIGAIHSISCHFTLHDKEPAIVVMPTGTGKTGVLFSSAFALKARRVLVITPSKLVREQIANGFKTLHLLITNNILPNTISKPKVKELKTKIDTQEKWEELEQYDVVVATTFGLPVHLWHANPSKELFDLLLIDEAHHSPAKTWNSLIQHFKPAKKVMFTATPFRRDKKEIKGRFIYNYPISKAFNDGIFGSVDFIPAIPYLEESNDLTLAKLAEKIFIEDKALGLKHNIMVRTNTKVHAKKLLELYNNNTSLKLKQVDSTQTEKQISDAIANLLSGTLDGIICVDMLGEGFDFPNLKIGVIHEPHQSLAITLQFIGRFARTNAKNIGTAKFIAIPNEINFLKLELYAEGAIWKDIIHEISERAIANEIEARETFDAFEDMPVDFEDDRDVSLYSLKPGFHVKIYDVSKSIDIRQLLTIPDNNVDKYFVSTELSVAVFLTKEVKKPRWLATDELVNVNFNLFIVFYDKANNLLYINSTRKTVDTYKQIASQYLGENPRQLSTEFVHRVISGINSPEVFNLGLRNKNAVNNAESYLMKTGSHVQNALKSNELNLYEGGHMFLRGLENSEFKTIGYSSSSKVWSNYSGVITQFLEWCKILSIKINSTDEIRTYTDIDRIGFRKVVDKIPLNPIFAVWPSEFFKSNLQYYYKLDTTILEGSIIDLEIKINSGTTTEIDFTVENEFFAQEMIFNLEDFFVIKGEGKFWLVDPDTADMVKLADYLNEFPPLFYFQDFTSLKLNEVSSKMTREYALINADKIETINWSDTDITAEFDGNPSGKKHIHEKLNEVLQARTPSILIYDHGSGEAADYISIKEKQDAIEVEFYHCKGAGGSKVGSRVGDFYEVCGQSVKSSLYTNTTSLRKKIKARLKRDNPSQFILGDETILNNLYLKNKMFQFKIFAVQPGLSKNKIDDKINELLSATEGYIEQGDQLKFRILCSE